MIEQDNTPLDNEIDEAYDDEVVDVATPEDEVVDDAPSEDVAIEQPVEEEQSTKKGKKKKKKSEKQPKGEKKPLSKRNKVIIIVTTILLSIAIIATAIAVPISISNRGKIFVGSAEDFENTEGDRYVLTDNVHVEGDLTLTNINNIDFNGKTLTIDGALKINSTSNDSVVIGLGEGKQIGTLQATEGISINATSDVIINAISKVGSMSIIAPNTTISQGMNLVENSSIISDKIEILANVEFADSTKENILSLLNASAIKVDAKVSGNVSIKNSLASEAAYPTSATINGPIYGNLLGDHTVSMVVNNKVTGIIDTNNKKIVDETPVVISKIGKVTLRPDSFVKDITNASYVLVHTDAIYPDMIGVDKVDIIRRLESVKFIDINKAEDKMIMTFAPVQGAEAYIVRIDEYEPIEIVETVLDITEYVRDVNTHRISVQAISKTNSEVLEPSLPLVCEHTTYLTLDKATGILLDKVEDKWMLTWNAVNFASEYDVTINGVELKATSNEMDVTEHITHGGSYLVSIVARSNNANVLPSRPSMYQRDVIVDLDEVQLTIVNNHPNMTLNWNEVANAKYYEVIMVSGEDEIVIYRTTANSFSAVAGDNYDGTIIKKDTTFKVRAVSASQYYNSVTSNGVIFEII